MTKGKKLSKTQLITDGQSAIKLMKKKTFEIEFYHRGDVIDTKAYENLPYIPFVGEVIYLQCENENMNEDGYYFKVLEKRSLFFSSPNLKQKVMINLEITNPEGW